MEKPHKKFIPSTYWKQIVSSIDFTVDDQFTIAACTKLGDLLEFFIDVNDGSVLNINSIDIDSSNVKEMKVFFTLHDEVKMFYLLLSESSTFLIVEKINKKLKVKEKIHRVTKFKICDVNHRGSPEVAIWYSNSKDPDLVMNFSDELFEQSASTKTPDKHFNALKRQLNLLDGKISDMQDLLNEKLFTKTTTVNNISQYSKECFLNINSVKHRIHHDQLFIIFELNNMKSIPITNLQLLLIIEHNITNYKFFVVDPDSFNIRHINTFKTKAFGIVMLDILDLTSLEFTLKGTLCYSLDIRNNLVQNEIPLKEIQVNTVGLCDENVLQTEENPIRYHTVGFPLVEVAASSFVQDSFQCLGSSSNTTLSNIYCIMLSLSKKSFSISNLSSLNQALSTNTSCSLLCVEQLPASCFFFCAHSGFLRGTLFFIDRSSNKLSVYYQSEHHIRTISLLLKNCIDPLDQEEASLPEFQEDISHCFKLLNNEILLDTVDEIPRDFFKINKKHLFEIQRTLSKY